MYSNTIQARIEATLKELYKNKIMLYKYYLLYIKDLEKITI